MKWLTCSLSALAFIGLIISTGCETETASENDVRISPSSIGLRPNQTAEFTASGGYEYTWSLSNDSIGVLTTRTGPRTVYINRSPVTESGSPSGSNTTAQVDSGETMVQILTVTSSPGFTETETQSSVSNGAPARVSGFIKTAEAIIEHLP